MPRLFQLNEATANYRIFPIFLVDSTSGVQPVTGETGTPQISKIGGAWSNISHPISGVGNGYYYALLEASELDTLGPFNIRYKSVNTLEFNMDGQVVAYDPYAVSNLGLTNLNTDVYRVIQSGDARWTTATGFSTHSATDVWADGVKASGAWIDAPISSIGGGSLTNDSIADAVWDEILSGHTTTGSAGGVLGATSGVIVSNRGDIIASGQVSWLTATGFSTHSRDDVTGGSYPLSTDGSGRVNVGKWLSTPIPTPNVSGVPIVDLSYLQGVAASGGGTVDSNITQWAGSGVVVGAIPPYKAGAVGGLTLSHDGVAISGGWIDAPISNAGGGTTPAEVWSYSSRVLTSGVDIVSFGGSGVKLAGSLPVVDIGSISGDAGAAANLSKSASTMVRGLPASGTTTDIWTNLTETTDDHYNGRAIVFYGGALAGEAARIEDYDGATKRLQVSALTENPTSSTPFIIV